jgi:hypothetical protein
MVLHVQDYEHIEPGELKAAKASVAQVFSDSGVRVEWTDGSARLAPADGRFHADVAMLDESRSAVDGSSPSVFGKANVQMRRATIYYPRVRAHAAATDSNPALVLALVLTHELGHLLLGENSHATFGVMQPQWKGRVLFVREFTARQAEQMRRVLSGDMPAGVSDNARSTPQ